MDATAGAAADPHADLHTRLLNSYRVAAGPLASALGDTASRVETAAAGLWRADPAVWSSDPQVQAAIANRLGWLSVGAAMEAAADRLAAFAATVAREFDHVVLLGMGGSSLAPEVMRSTLGPVRGYPTFHMIDSTDPAAVRAVDTPPARTLYILASKSGTTIEPNALAAHFRGRLEAAGVATWGAHFVAITDDGTALARRAAAEGFRETFINRSDIGGRYSALSYSGLVPAAVMGHDLSALLRWGGAMLSAARTAAAENNPAVALGALMAAGARHKRDKLTLLLPAQLEPFGLWVEQLVAESTGKHGVGVVPIAGERPFAAAAYGSDRVFVHNRLQTKAGDVGHGASTVAELKEAGHPVAEIVWAEPLALGAEFMRWEIATAICGALLDINPFDEPNVQQAKDATRVLLDLHQRTGALPVDAGDQRVGDATLTAAPVARERLGSQPPAALLSLVEPGDYVAVLAYVGPDQELSRALREFRDAIGERTRTATMFGYGPRYLHST